jgi:hypothetical protein
MGSVLADFGRPFGPNKINIWQGFDADTKHVFSGGNDERVYVHDVESNKFVDQGSILQKLNFGRKRFG